MNGEDLTVVIPTYRRPRLLARALLSVIRQRIPGLTIRVFDNASGDETARVVRGLGQRQPIEYVCRPENLGVSANIAGAIDSVTTPWCAILNDDDMQLPGLLAAAIDALTAHPSAAAFCGRTLIYATNARGGEPSLDVQGKGWQAGYYRAGTATMHMVREHFTPTAVVFATPALQAARFTLGDMEMMARLAERHDFAVTDRVLGVYVIHPRAWSASHSFAEGRRASLRRLQEYLELETLSTDERLEVVLKSLTELMTDQLGHALGAALRGDDPRPARRDLARAGALLGALSFERASVAERFLHAAVAAVAGRSEAPLSRATVLGLRGASKVAGAIHRLTTPARRVTEAEKTAAAEVSLLDWEAEALFATL